MKKNMRMFLSYALPSVIAMLIVGSYNIVDSIFIGQYAGPMGLATVALTWPLVMVFGALGDMFGTGAAVIVSQSRGRNDNAHARKVFGTMLFCQFMCSMILLFPTLYFTPAILNLFGATPDMLGPACEYARVLIWGALAAMLTQGLGAVIRNDNRPVLAMMFIIMGLLMNVTLDYILIFRFDMGLRGAALATVISQSVGVLGQLTYFGTKYTKLRYGRDMLCMRIRYVRDIIISGFPSFGNQIAIITMLFLHNFQAMRYGGTIGLAIYSFIGAVGSLGSLFMTGLALGVQPLAAYLYGGKKHREQNAIGNIGYVFAAFFGMLLMLMAFLGRNIYPHWFNLTGQLGAMAAHGLVISSTMFVLLGVVRVAVYYYQATGKIGYANMLIYGDAFVVLPLCLFILPMIFGLDGVWMAMPVSRLLLFLVVCWLWWGIKRPHINKLKKRPTGRFFIRTE